MEENLKIFEDPNFKFNKDLHEYTYNNNGKPVQKFTSVTGFLSKFKKPYDSDYWAARKAQERGITKQEILNEWSQISKKANTLGTNVHKWIEDFYNKKNPDIPTDEIFKNRILNFLEIYNKRLNKLTPIHQELRIFSREWGIAGTLDGLFKMDNNYYIGDYKTNKTFTTNSDKCYNKLLMPFESYYENSLTTYSIQISLYRLILEYEANFKTNGGFIVWIGPNNQTKLYKTLDFTKQLKTYLTTFNL